MGSQISEMVAKETGITGSETHEPSPPLISSPSRSGVGGDGSTDAQWSYLPPSASPPPPPPPSLPPHPSSSSSSTSPPHPSSPQLPPPPPALLSPIVDEIQGQPHATPSFSIGQVHATGNPYRAELLRRRRNANNQRHRLEQADTVLASAPENLDRQQTETPTRSESETTPAPADNGTGSASSDIQSPSTSAPRSVSQDPTYWGIEGQVNEIPDQDPISSHADENTDEIRDQDVSSDESNASERSSISLGSPVPRTPDPAAISLAEGLADRLLRLRLDSPTLGNTPETIRVLDSQIARDPLSSLELESRRASKVGAFAGNNRQSNASDAESAESAESQAQECRTHTPSTENWSDLSKHPKPLQKPEPEVQVESEPDPQGAATLETVLSSDADQSVNVNADTDIDRTDESLVPHDRERHLAHRVGTAGYTPQEPTKSHHHEMEFDQHIETASPRPDERRILHGRTADSNQDVETSFPSREGTAESMESLVESDQHGGTASSQLDDSSNEPEDCSAMPEQYRRTSSSQSDDLNEPDNSDDSDDSCDSFYDAPEHPLTQHQRTIFSIAFF